MVRPRARWSLAQKVVILGSILLDDGNGIDPRDHGKRIHTIRWGKEACNMVIAPVCGMRQSAVAVEDSRWLNGYNIHYSDNSKYVKRNEPYVHRSADIYYSSLYLIKIFTCWFYRPTYDIPITPWENVRITLDKRRRVEIFKRRNAASSLLANTREVENNIFKHIVRRTLDRHLKII